MAERVWAYSEPLSVAGLMAGILALVPGLAGRFVEAMLLCGIGLALLLTAFISGVLTA